LNNRIIPQKYIDRVLTPRQQGFGFELEEDDHVLTLKLKSEVKARWLISHFEPSIITIQEKADRVMETELGLFEFWR
jgi:hypothetical protein